MFKEGISKDSTAQVNLTITRHNCLNGGLPFEYPPADALF